MSQHNAILITLDKQRLPGGILATVCALDEGRGLITVGTDIFEYISPSTALAEWFRWLFSGNDARRAPTK